MAYKLIALDIDGTVLTSHHTIAEPTRTAVRRALDRGVRVTLATGRAFPSALRIARELGLTGTPLVTHDGAYVADPVTGAVLHQDPIPLQVAREAAHHLQACGITVNVLYPDVLVSNRRLRQLMLKLLNPRYWSAAPMFWAESRAYRHTFANDLPTYMAQAGVNPPKLFLTGTEEQIAAGRKLLAERWSDTLRLTPAGPDALEVTAQGVSKASGLSVLAASLGIGAHEVVCIGDNYNDAEMITQAGLGVAMGNAPEEIRRLANVVTRTNDEHGVAYAIERYVLEQSA